MHIYGSYRKIKTGMPFFGTPGMCYIMLKIRYTPFPATGKLPTCCGRVTYLANKSATSRQQVVVMEFGKRHDTTDTTDFYRH